MLPQEKKIYIEQSQKNRVDYEIKKHQFDELKKKSAP